MTTPNSKKRRRRDSIALSDVGYEAVQIALGKLRMTQDIWAFRSSVSIATVKRLLRGNRVDRGCFYALLTSLGLEVKDDYMIIETVNIGPSPLPDDEFFIHQGTLGIFMTATFDPANRSRIDRVLQHLQKLLTDCEVTFHPDDNSFSLAGDIPENKRQHIEMTIKRLEALLTSCEVTWS